MNPLKLLVVEYATSTGLAEFIPEGLSMLATLVNDFIGCGCEVSYLSNEYILRAGRRVPSSKDNFEQVLERELQYVDGALLIAPDDLMVHLSKLLDDAEAVNLGCPSSSVMECADKLRTWKVLKSADIPTPNPWVGDGFVICKPRMGCGTKGVKVCTEPIVGEGMDEEDWTYWEFSEGEAYSVGCVLSDDTSRAISLTHQLIEFESADGERYAHPSVREALKRERTLDVNYLGNVVPAHHPLIEEAIRLSLKAAETLGCRGFVGVDIIIDEEVQVVEVNPRPTTPILAMSNLSPFSVGELILRASFPDRFGSLSEISERMPVHGSMKLLRSELLSYLSYIGFI